jgi:ABC-2 type transport system permease protein
MTALLRLTGLSLTLNFRNRMAILYGYLFPLLFLVAFWAIYRSDRPPLAPHIGQLLTVTVLGGACFGLPTTLVGERERGVWRRYRLLPAPVWTFIIAVLAARYLLLLSAALLQLALGWAIGMPLPLHPFSLWLAFSAAAAAFLGLGMTIAMLAGSVPAVQALGQCIFLPMLMIGGVAVRISSLPDWAQHMSVFFPGRYAVEALQAAAAGPGLSVAGFDLLALVLTGIAGALAAAGLFRWDRSFAPRKAWLVGALGVWAVTGIMAEAQGRVAVSADTQEVGGSRDYLAQPKKTAPAAPPAPSSWREVTDRDIAAIAFDRLPPDEGIVSPVSRADEAPDPAATEQLDNIRDALPGWAPGNVADPMQRTRNLLAVAAVPDVLEMEQIERFVPRLVFARLQAVIPPRDLPKILYWVAMHPKGGDDAAIHRLAGLGLPDVRGPTGPARGRIMLYAFKLLGRLTGHIPAN